ncbi:DNA translocase FtsK 4TM domain-containing protein, partial [Candidatus Margulisiibacteriota bacterium]
MKKKKNQKRAALKKATIRKTEVKKKQKKEPVSKKTNTFFLSLICFGVAFFIFQSNHAPQASGFVGRQLISFYGKRILGGSIDILPALLVFAGIALLFSLKRWKTILITVLSSILSYSVFLSLKVYKTTLVSLTIPMSEQGGGWLGNLILFGLQRIIGSTGAWILLGVVTAMVCLLFLNFLIRIPLKRTVSSFIKLKSLLVGKSYPEIKKQLLKKTIYILFFKKIVNKIKKKAKVKSFEEEAFEIS